MCSAAVDGEEVALPGGEVGSDGSLLAGHQGYLLAGGESEGADPVRVDVQLHRPYRACCYQHARPTKALHTGRVLAKFSTIADRLAGMVDRFTSMLDRVDIAFSPDGILDQLPTASQIGATRVGGIDLNRARMRSTLDAVLAPDGFTVTDLAEKVQALTDQSPAAYTTRQAAYDLRKLRGKELMVKPDRSRRYHVPSEAARTIAALQALRDHIIAPILAAVRRPGPGPPPNTYTRLDRDYDHPPQGMRTLFHDLAIDAAA